METKLSKEKIKLYLLIIAYVIGLILLVIHFETVLKWIKNLLRLFLPLFIGIAIAFIFNRPFELFNKIYCQKLKIKETASKFLAIITIYILFFGIVILLLSIIIPELFDNVLTFTENADFYLIEAPSGVNRIMDFLGLKPVDFSDLLNKAAEFFSTVSDTIKNLLPQIIEVTSNFISGFATFFISIAISIYIIGGKDRLMTQAKRIFRVYVPHKVLTPVRSLLHTVVQVFEDYITGQCKEALILGTLCFLGMTVLHLDYAALISVIIACTALVPILGAYIGGGIGVLLLLFISPQKAFIFLVFLIILQQFEGNVIYPRVVGRKIGLPGLWVLVAISAGGGIGGVLGMLLGVPVATVIYQLIKKDVTYRESRQSNIP